MFKRMKPHPMKWEIREATKWVLSTRPAPLVKRSELSDIHDVNCRRHRMSSFRHRRKFSFTLSKVTILQQYVKGDTMDSGFGWQTVGFIVDEFPYKGYEVGK